ncbi:MAG TPA: GAF domain-containing protein, partial [Candidatus Binatia bacterium]
MAISDRMAEALRESYQGLEKKITDRTRDLAALYAALAPLASSDPAQLLQQIVERLKEATGADAALIRIIDKKTKSFLSPAQVGFPSSFLEATQNLDPSSAAHSAFISGAPVISADISTDGRLKSKKQFEAGFRSCAFLPFKVSGELRGILHLVSREIGHFSTDKTDHLMAIARQMGVAMENRELLEESRERAEQQASLVKSLSLLVNASQKLVERVDIDTLAQDILETVVTSFGIRLAWIGSAESDGRVRPLYWAGDVAEYLRHVEIRWDDSSLGQGPAGQAIRTGQPVVMDVATDPGFAPWRDPALAHGYREVAAFPLIRGAKPFGHLILYSAHNGFFTPERVELLQTYANIATGALESARLFEETRRQAEENAALNTIATAVSQSLDVQQILNIAMDKVLEVTGRDRGYIRLKDPVTGEITLAAHKGISARYADVLIHHRTGGGKTDQVFATGKALILNDLKETPLKGETRREGQNVMAWIPINARGNVVGILNVASTRQVPFSTREVELLQAIGNVIGVALENAWLYQESRQQQEMQKLLKELSQDATSLDISVLLKKVTDKVREFFKVDISDIRLIEDDGMRRLVGSSGIDSERLYRVGSNRGRTGWIIDNRQPLMIADISKETDMPAGETVRELGIRGYLAVPLFARTGEVIGVLRALTYDPREFSQSELDLLQQLANGIAIAIENARLFEETEERAHEQAALSAIATVTTQSLQIYELLQIAVEKVLEVTGRERAYIRLKDPLSGEIRLAAHKNISEAAKNLLKQRTPGGKSDQVFETGEPLIVNDAETSAVRDRARGQESRAIAWIPLKAQGKVIGLLNIATDRPVPFTPREVNLLRAIGDVIGVAVANAWLFEETQRQEKIQELLKELSQDITSLHIDVLFQKVTDKVREFFKVDISDIRLLEEGGIRRTVGSSGVASQRLYKLGTGRGRSGWMRKNRRPLIIRDLRKDASIPAGETTKELGVRGYVAAPLFSRSGEVIGILRALTYEPRQFSQSEVDLLQQLANGTAIAAANAQLFQETEQRAREQAALNAIATATSQSLRIDEVLQIALDKVLEVTGHEKGYIRLKDPVTQELRLTAHRGISEKYTQMLLFHRAPGGKSDQVLQSGEPLIINKPEEALLREETRREGNSSMAWIPLKAQGKVLGILNVSTAQAVSFTSREVDLLQAIGNVIGVAVENARLFEESRRQEAIQKLLKELSQDITSLDIDALFSKVTDKVREFFKVDVSDIRLLEGGRRRTVGSSGIKSDRLYKLGMSRGRSGWMRENRRALVIPDLTKNTSGVPSGETTNELGIRGYLAVPLFSRSGEVIGILRALTYEPREFSQSEVDLVQQLANGTAIALANARLFEETQQRAEEQAVLNAVAMATSESLHLDELLQKSLDSVLYVMGRDQGYIRLQDPVTGELRLVAHQGISQEYIEILLHRRTPGGKGDQVLKSGEVLVINDVQAAPLKQETRSEGSHALIWVPLKARGKVVGLLNISASRPIPFAPREVELLQAIGNVIGVALENARLFQETERRRREAEELARVAQSLTETLDMTAVGERIATSVRELFDVNASTLRLLQPDGSLRTLASTGEGFAIDSAGDVLLAGMGLASLAVAEGRPIWSADVLKEPNIRLTDEMRDYHLRSGNCSMIAVPLRAHERIIGSLGLADKTGRIYSDREVALVQTFADQAALALENARLFLETEQRAQEQAVLNAIAMATSKALHIDELLQVALDKVLEVTGRERGSIRLKDPVTGEIVLVAHRGLSPEEIEGLARTVSRQATDRVFESGQSLVIHDRPEPRESSSLLPQSRSVAWVPIKAGEKVAGVLCVSTTKPVPFDQHEVDLLQAIGSVIGVALENARLFHETEQKAKHLSTLHTVASTVSASLDLDQLVAKALDIILEVTGMDAGHIRLLEGDPPRLRLRVHKGVPPNLVERLQRQTRDGGKAEQVLTSRRSLIFEAPDTSGPERAPQLLSMGFTTAVWIPITLRDKALGIINIATAGGKSFNKNQVGLLEAIGASLGVALDNARLFEETERRAREQAALYAVTAAVSGSFDIEQILLKGLDAVLEVTKMEGGYIQFLDGTPPRLILRVHRGMSQSFVAKTRNEIRAGGKTEQIIATKQPVVLEDISPDHEGKFQEEKITAAAWVPITSKDKVIAILAVSTKTKRTFPQAQLPLLMSIGNALGMALENAKLFQQTERNLERIRALREIDQAISSTLDLRRVLDILLEKIDLSLPYATATIRLFNKETGNLEPVACRNLDEKEWKSSQWAGGRGIANVVFETKAPLIIRNAQADSRVLDVEFYRKHKLTSYVGVPLVVKDETLGVLGFYTKEEHEFTGEEVDFLSTLAGQAAIAIHNSQLYENTRLREKQLQETNRMLSALHAVAAAVSQSVDLDRVLQAAIGKITEIFGFDATQIHIYSERTDELLLKAAFEKDPNRFASVQSVGRGQGVIGRVAESGKPIIFEDVQTDPLYRRLSRTKTSSQSGYRLFAVFPIRGKLRNLGTLACTGIEPRKLNSGEIQLLEAMADQIAVAIENGELYVQLKQKITELEEANKVKDEFLSVMSHELRTPLNVIMGYTAMIKDEMLGGVN